MSEQPWYRLIIEFDGSQEYAGTWFDSDDLAELQRLKRRIDRLILLVRGGRRGHSWDEFEFPDGSCWEIGQFVSATIYQSLEAA